MRFVTRHLSGPLAITEQKHNENSSAHNIEAEHKHWPIYERARKLFESLVCILSRAGNYRDTIWCSQNDVVPGGEPFVHCEDCFQNYRAWTTYLYAKDYFMMLWGS